MDPSTPVVIDEDETEQRDTGESKEGNQAPAREEAVIMRGKSSAAKKYSVGIHCHRTVGKERVQGGARKGTSRE